MRNFLCNPEKFSERETMHVYARHYFICLSLFLALPLMLTKPVATTAATATRAGCVWRGLGTPFAWRSSGPAAEDDQRPSILQLNTEGITANKISIIEQLAYKNKALVIVLQETHCTTADKLVIPNFSLAG